MMQKNDFKIFLISLIIIPFFSIKAQDTSFVSQESLLNKINQNWKVKLAKKEEASSRADYHQSNAVFLPQLNLSYTALTTTNPLMAFGSKLNQEILSPQDFNQALLNDPDRTDNFAAEFSVIQPLFNADGLYQRRAAKAKMQAMKLKAQRTEEGMKLEVSKTYMQLQLSYEAIAVLEKAVIAAKASLKMVLDYYNAGMIQKADLLSVQLRVNEMELEKSTAESNLNNVSDYLAFLVNDTASIIYKPIDHLSSFIELSKNIEGDIGKRSDVIAMQRAADAYKQLSLSSKAEMLPRINAFGKYQLYDNEFLQTDADGYLLGIRLSWNIFNGYKNIAKTQRDRINYEKSKLEADEYLANSVLELKKFQRQLFLLQQKVQNNKKAVEQNKEAYKIRKDRFQLGLEKTNDLLHSEALLFQKELEHLQSIFEYQLTQQYITFLTN